MFVVVAAVEANPTDRERFLAVAHEDATKSVESEPGCRQFDVCGDPAREGSILFYEVYDDAAAFEEHKAHQPLQDLRRGKPIFDRSQRRTLSQ